jgi:Spy/CpxP family protein refolding chaperone
MGGMLLKDITLTDAQKEHIKTIREKYVPKQLELRKAVQATGAPPDEPSRAKMMELQNQQSAEIRAILTADQKAIFDKNRSDMKARMEARSKGGN